MEATIRFIRLVAPLCALAVLVACEHPPDKEIAAAEAAIAQAKSSEAARYAPDRLKEAEDALSAARQKVQDKDYRGALSSAMEAAERSRAAAQAAGAAKTVARSAAEVAQAEIQAVLDEAAGVREEATGNKVPETAFEDVDALVKQIADGLVSITQTIETGAVLEAQKAALELKTKAAPVPGLFREAADKWQAEHPKGRGTPPAKKAAVKK
jgi:hypothetical protein